VQIFHCIVLYCIVIHPTSAFALPGKNRTDKICIKINKKLYKIFIFPDMWPPTANQLQGLTAVQQQVY